MPETGPDGIQVELIYALPDAAHRFVVSLAAGSCVGDAIRACAGLNAIAALAGRPLNVGIFGRACELGDPVRHGDRIEIYRDLLADPKLARRRRAAGQAD
jgi:hypothetical protein